MSGGVLTGALDMLARDARNDTYRADPVAWSQDVLGIHLWSKQREIAESLLHNKRTVVASCHSSGKSLVSSVLSCWWIAVHPPGSAFVVSTAPTYRQVNAILWREMRKHMRTSIQRGTPLPGNITGADLWKLDNGDLVGMGRKPADGDEHGFQGIHARYVLVIIDEAAGVPEQLWTGVEAITTTANSRILAIGNPDDRETVFGDVFCEDRYAPLWKRITIPASSTPNFTGEVVPDPLPDVLVQTHWVSDRLAAWGSDDARYQSKVEAKFPTSNAMGLFGEPLLARAFIDESDPAQAQVPKQGDLILGVDVARFGDDKSVVVARRGRRVWVVDSWNGMDTVTTAEQVYALAYELALKDERGKVAENVDIRVDSVGVGAGVVDTLAAKRSAQMMRYGHCWFTVREMNGAARVPQNMGGSVHGYGNARAWWHDQLKHQMRNGRVLLDEHEQLRGELRGVRMRYSSGKMYIVSKEEMRKEGRKSPDFVDATVYACAPVFEGVEELVAQASAAELSEELKYSNFARQFEMDRAMTISPY